MVVSRGDVRGSPDPEAEAATGAALDGAAPSTVAGAAVRVAGNPFLAVSAGEGFLAAAQAALRALAQLCCNAVAGCEAAREVAWEPSGALALALLTLPLSLRDDRLAAVACSLVHGCCCGDGGPARLAGALGRRALLEALLDASRPGKVAGGTSALPPAAHWVLLLSGAALDAGALGVALRSLTGGAREDDGAVGDESAAAGDGVAAASASASPPAPEPRDAARSRAAAQSSILLLRIARDATAPGEGGGHVIGPADADEAAAAAARSIRSFLRGAAASPSAVAWALDPAPAGSSSFGSEEAAEASTACLEGEAALAALDLTGDAFEAAHRASEGGRAAEVDGWDVAGTGVGLLLAACCDALTVLPLPVKARSDREAAATGFEEPDGEPRAAAGAEGSAAGKGAGGAPSPGPPPATVPAVKPVSPVPVAPPVPQPGHVPEVSGAGGLSRAELAAWAADDPAIERVRRSALALDLRAACARLAANALHRNAAASDAAAACGLLGALLGQTRMEHGIARPVIREFSLLAIRNACESSKEAQAYVTKLQPRAVADPEAIRAMGIRAARDEASGRVSVSAVPGDARWRSPEAAGPPSGAGAAGAAPASASSQGGAARAEESARKVIDDGEIQM